MVDRRNGTLAAPPKKSDVARLDYVVEVFGAVATPGEVAVTSPGSGASAAAIQAAFESMQDKFIGRIIRIYSIAKSKVPPSLDKWNSLLVNSVVNNATAAATVEPGAMERLKQDMPEEEAAAIPTRPAGTGPATRKKKSTRKVTITHSKKRRVDVPGASSEGASAEAEGAVAEGAVAAAGTQMEDDDDGDDDDDEELLAGVLAGDFGI